jgi:mycothiol synthase
MQYKIERVTPENESELISYSAAHGAEHDSSYLPGRDFELSDEHPSYLLKEAGRVVGAVSLMLTKRYLSVNKGRFSIIHSVLNSVEAYQQLLDAVQPHIKDLKSIFLFIPEINKATTAILSQLGFDIERYAFLLERDNSRIAEPVFPEGFSIQRLIPSNLEGISQFAACLNEEFKELAGHTTNTPEELQTWFDDQSYVEGGLCLLKYGEEPVGTIGLMKDMDNLAAGEITAFGLLKQYRGRDLGRKLLRFGINYLAGQDLDPIMLSVNGENHGAIQLYKSEGFQLTESLVAYKLEIA